MKMNEAECSESSSFRSLWLWLMLAVTHTVLEAKQTKTGVYMPSPTRYAVVETGSRCKMFLNAIYKLFPESCRLVGLCDINPTRLQVANDELAQAYETEPVPMYGVDEFERMIRDQQVDTVIVTSMDRTHHTYICRAMEAGCDVISEKPMTVDAEKCAEILAVQQRTGKDLRVTFNYRHAPRNSRVKELLQEGVIGEVKSVHFEWLLDTNHGADYFRRWHRDKRNSGGLMVHKATHHFDLVNWWLDSQPREVFGMGDLVFYGRENAEERGVREFYVRGTGSDIASQDPFALDMAKENNAELKKMYHSAEHHDGYLRDQSVFNYGISIEDDMSVLVRYANKAVMTYHLTAYSPWEGYRVMFNGTEGRLELEVQERPYVSGADDDHNQAVNVGGGVDFEIEEPTSILLRRHWQKPQKIEIEESNQGGHGGGDQRLLADLFTPGSEADPLGRAAGHVDGALSILTGIAANRCFQTGQIVQVSDLLPPELI